jgi:putative membrane protein
MEIKNVKIWISSLLCIGLFSSDLPFYSKASEANLTEIQAGKMAQSKGNTAVKNLAQQMVTDFTTAQTDLVAASAKRAGKISLVPDVQNQKILDHLSQLSGNAFDSAYLKMESMNHQFVIALYKDEAFAGSDPVAKAYALKYLPTLQKHGKMIQAFR